MDFFGSTRVLEYLAKSRTEKYANSPAPSSIVPTNTKFSIFSLGGVVSFVVGIVIGVVAVYLSWTCNTALQYGTALKVIFAILAYLFGFLYIILYMIMRYDTCTYIKKTGYY